MENQHSIRAADMYHMKIHFMEEKKNLFNVTTDYL